MSGQEQPLQNPEPLLLPLVRGQDQHGQGGKVEGPVGSVAGVDPALPGLIQKGRQVLLLPAGRPRGVQDVQGHVQDVGHQIHVALRSAASRFFTEASILGKPKQNL